MTATYQQFTPMELPPLPAKHADWIAHVSSHADKPLGELMAPYKDYDAKLREIFAQQPEHPAIVTPNIVPVFAGHENDLIVRARDLTNESEDERQRYLMPLSTADRKPNGTPAVVKSLNDFQKNFQLFSESSLVDMDWSNVVAAGSAVVTSLLPVPEQHKASRRALREYYHQKLAPASDVDLFLYGLSEEEAIEKIKQIEQRIKDSILAETTTVRTKNAITIVSQHPVRHVQIVLRIYRSISEILTGFDVDCSCVAYDGKQVYASPRALAAFMTQINTIDLTRRSPSYENRLAKYARRGFEVHWPLLDRSRIDPTLFERSFGRTLGLARLLVLEKLPKSSDRDAYVDQRRIERGRPRINRYATRKLRGDIKQEHEEDVAEWVETDQVSDYHTFTIPYGPQFHARKIEKLLYVKDLLLNAEWNRPKERETTLHRHPAFFGDATDVIQDCCGYCPEPVTPEEKEVAAEESKIYVSGTLSFLKDDPGRQAIGSFNPLTDDDWTEMAYIGNTESLCRAIVEGDLEHVQDWLGQEGADPNRRDYTGRTPLHLAVMTSTPQVVQALIDAGARLVSRLFDGKTALHLAAMRGQVEMVKAILTKSEANEEDEAERAALKQIHQGKPTNDSDAGPEEPREEEFDKDDSDTSDDDSEDEDSEDEDATTEGSFIKITRREPQIQEALPEDTDDEPDVYDVNVLAWDVPVSALHLAIANGHVEVVKLLVQEFGADVLLPVKLFHEYSKNPRAAILPVVLALYLSPKKAEEMTKILIDLGASPAQADLDQVTALNYFAAYGANLLRAMISSNRPAAERVANHVSRDSRQWIHDAKYALLTAIENGDAEAVDVLLDLGTTPEVDISTRAAALKNENKVICDDEEYLLLMKGYFDQPIFSAVRKDMLSVVRKLLEAGADINCLNATAWKAVKEASYSHRDTGTLLDMVRRRMAALRTFVDTGKVEGVDGRTDSTGWVDDPFKTKCLPPVPLQDDSHYLEGYKQNTYAHWMVRTQIKKAKVAHTDRMKQYEKWLESQKEGEGMKAKKLAVQTVLEEYEMLESHLVEHGAKTFEELYPEVQFKPMPAYSYWGFNQEAPKPWKPILAFQHPYMTEDRKAAYIKLFEACWEGDLSTIKELTLAMWGNNQTPLQIAVQDSENFSPFSIAVFCKHYNIASAILEIARAQYSLPETPLTKHTIRPVDEDDTSTDGGRDDIQIYSEIVDDKFTVEDIGEMQVKVQSTVKPTEMILWRCATFMFPHEYCMSRDFSHPPSRFSIGDDNRPYNLFQLAIYMNDSELLKFLITKCEEYTQATPGAADEITTSFFRFSEQDFQYAIQFGRVELLEKIIRRTGAGFPLDDLVSKSGVEMPVKPEYYQGLSVHGKKRKDWANAARGIQSEVPAAQHPPLLHAAHLGSLKSVEWFMSDAALRCYSQFADDHHEDVRIQNLAKTKGGVQASITKWLDFHSHLLLHCVVLGKDRKKASLLLGQLCKKYPEALEHRSASGMTPLHLAFTLRHVEMAKTLLDAGADQTSRTNDGSNIIHSLLATQGNLMMDVDAVRELLGLIDARLIPSLFLERTTNNPGAATPLAYWIHITKNAWESEISKSTYEGILRLLLEASKGEDLGVINSHGDTPVHTVVSSGADSMLRIMLECRPELLFRENASGCTPLEKAENIHHAYVFCGPPPLLRDNRGKHRMNGCEGLLEQEPKSFVKEPEDVRLSSEKVLQVCKDFAADQSKGHKRRLISLVEANEVARRLASRTEMGNARNNASREELEGEKEDSNGQNSDEVTAWFNWDQEYPAAMRGLIYEKALMYNMYH